MGDVIWGDLTTDMTESENISRIWFHRLGVSAGTLLGWGATGNPWGARAGGAIGGRMAMYAYDNPSDALKKYAWTNPGYQTVRYAQYVGRPEKGWFKSGDTQLEKDVKKYGAKIKGVFDDLNPF